MGKLFLVSVFIFTKNRAHCQNCKYYDKMIPFLNILLFSGERHLGYSRQDLLGVSFYHMLHPDSMRELQSKHRLGRQSIS